MSDEGVTCATDTERPERKEKEEHGMTTVEADDCRFPVSPSRTVHERDEWSGDAHDYDYHPRCGQRLPANSMWGRVDAESVEEAVLKYDLKPCGKCLSNSYQLGKWRNAIHSNSALSSADDVPDDVLREAGLERYIDTGTEHGGSDE
jgi:hypothetical protein